MTRHRSHASRVTTNRSQRKYLAVSLRRKARSWQHTFWVTNNEIFAKNILPFCLKRHQEGQKETRKQKRLWHIFLRYMQTQ